LVEDLPDAIVIIQHDKYVNFNTQFADSEKFYRMLFALSPTGILLFAGGSNWHPDGPKEKMSSPLTGSLSKCIFMVISSPTFIFSGTT
jgi:hypothetical protein